LVLEPGLAQVRELAVLASVLVWLSDRCHTQKS
jgi:hypothetical protein